MSPGDSISRECIGAISASSVFLYFASPSALASGAVQSELQHALSLESVRVVVVRPDQDSPIPAILRDRLYVNVEAGEIHGGVSHLMNEIAPFARRDDEAIGGHVSATLRIHQGNVIYSWRNVKPSNNTIPDRRHRVAVLDDFYDRLDWQLTRHLDTTLREIQDRFSEDEATYLSWDSLRHFGSLVVPEVSRLCNLSIHSTTALTPNHRYEEAAHISAIRCLALRMNAATKYLDRFFDDLAMTPLEYESLLPTDPYPEGTKCDFASYGKTIGAIRVPYIQPWEVPEGMTDPQRDIFSYELGKAIGHRLALQFPSAGPTIEFPPLESLRYGLA